MTPVGTALLAATSTDLMQARWLMALSLDGLPIGNGILTVENEAQAWARARVTEKDKGGEAAKAALAMLALREKFA